jgi:hypothetical protein
MGKAKMISVTQTVYFWETLDPSARLYVSHNLIFYSTFLSLFPINRIDLSQVTSFKMTRLIRFWTAGQVVTAGTQTLRKFLFALPSGGHGFTLLCKFNMNSVIFLLFFLGISFPYVAPAGLGPLDWGRSPIWNSRGCLTTVLYHHTWLLQYLIIQASLESYFNLFPSEFQFVFQFLSRGK